MIIIGPGVTATTIGQSVTTGITILGMLRLSQELIIRLLRN